LRSPARPPGASFPGPTGFGHCLGTVASPVQIVTVAAAIFAAFLFEALFRYTRRGQACLAVAEDRDPAMLRGVNVSRLSLIAFTVAGAFGGLVGYLIGPITYADATLATTIALYGFVAVALGGEGSFVGGLIGGLVVGLASTFATTYIVAAVQGAAVGGGLGLALSADFRVARPDSRLSANFARLGFHHGFGLSVTLPAVVGMQRALDLLYTGRSVAGAEALQIGLCDRLADGDVRAAALELATEIGASAPLSLAAIRATMRRRLVAEVHAALEAEADAQASLLSTADFREGISASIERRRPTFSGS